MPLYSHTLYLVRREVKGILKFASQRKGEIWIQTKHLEWTEKFVFSLFFSLFKSSECTQKVKSFWYLVVKNKFTICSLLQILQTK